MSYAIPLPQLGIPSANKLSVSQQASQLPDMGTTVRSYFRPLILVFVQKTIEDFEIVEARRELRCLGAIQPFASTDLRIKPEGQRTWKWQMLHTTREVALKNDMEFTSNGIRYRVMGQLPYQGFGFLQYELVQDYNGRTD